VKFAKYRDLKTTTTTKNSQDKETKKPRLKAAREKKFLTYKERQIRFAANLPTEDLSGYKQHAEWEKYAAKNTLSSKAVIQNTRRNKEFPRQKVNEFMITKPALQELLRGTF